MAKILSYKNKRNNVIIPVSLIASIVITNSFIVFSPDEDSRRMENVQVGMVDLTMTKLVHAIKRVT
jgi:hypothetical protein